MPSKDEFPHPQVRIALRKLFEEDIVFNQMLGIKVVSFNPVRPRVRFDMRPELIGHPVRKVLHGGVIAAVLDATAGFAIMLALAKKHENDPDEVQLGHFRHMSTIDLRIDYIRPGRGAHFIALGHVFRVGGKVASVRMELENDSGEIIAAGSAAFMVG